jgi:hypothetical protein
MAFGGVEGEPRGAATLSAAAVLAFAFVATAFSWAGAW